jgi:hypothetical protein
MNELRVVCLQFSGQEAQGSRAHQIWCLSLLELVYLLYDMCLSMHACVPTADALVNCKSALATTLVRSPFLGLQSVFCTQNTNQEKEVDPGAMCGACHEKWQIGVCPTSPLHHM